MSNAVEQAQKYIENEEYEQALKLARKRHGKDDIDEYLTILDMLNDAGYILALEEKGLYYQYYDENHDNGDYGEKYFNAYLEKQPRSINVICDKALSRFNKGKIDESIELMDNAYDKYKSYSKIEKPRISKNEVLMGKIELLIQAKRYNDALLYLNKYETLTNGDEKSDLYKGVALQKMGKNSEAIEYLDKSLQNEDTLMALNSKGDALFELKQYKDALKAYDMCIQKESAVKEDLEMITNFNYKAAYCCVNQGNDGEAIKYLNKTINFLNEKGRLPNDIEKIYQKCSFEKERIMKTGQVKDQEFKKTRFMPMKTSLIILAVILVLYVILRLLGYGN